MKSPCFRAILRTVSQRLQLQTPMTTVSGVLEKARLGKSQRRKNQEAFVSDLPSRFRSATDRHWEKRMALRCVDVSGRFCSEIPLGTRHRAKNQTGSPLYGNGNSELVPPQNLVPAADGPDWWTVDPRL